jgi:hypothetical protein
MEASPIVISGRYRGGGFLNGGDGGIGALGIAGEGRG